MQVFTKVITVAAAGTPQVIGTPTGAPLGVFCKVGIYGLGANSGASVYVGLSGFVKATGVGLLAPAIAKNADSFFIEDQGGFNTVDPSQFFVDVDTSADKVIAVFYQS